MGPLLRKLQDNFCLKVRCASCDSECEVFTGTQGEHPGEVCVCVCGALLCGYSCGTAACPCCGSRCRLYTSAIAWASQWSAAAWDAAQCGKHGLGCGLYRRSDQLHAKLAALEHRVACAAARSWLTGARTGAVVGPLVVPAMPSGQLEHWRHWSNTVQYFLHWPGCDGSSSSADSSDGGADGCGDGGADDSRSHVFLGLRFWGLGLQVHNPRITPQRPDLAL